MSDTPWHTRLSPKALAVLQELPEDAREMLRDVMDIAGRDPWSFSPFDSCGIEGEDVRAAAVGQLIAVYWINRPAGRLCVIDIVWLVTDDASLGELARLLSGKAAVRALC
ncbi:hypothetical protein ABZZ74_43600 [Streptomyces sp. NPDC006476]|uniref:hypothetical protein n=1 Tax=Streptomyces sp. NPDC006476 TaxID=3157175 RepID=UPI0033B015AA